MPEDYDTWEAYIQDHWPNEGLNIHSDSNMHSLVSGLIEHHEERSSDIDNIADSRHLDTATGQDLDNWAELADVSRRDGETDDKFRERIRRIIRSGTSGGTTEDVKEFAISMLSADDPNDIEVLGRYDTHPATAFVVIDSTLLSNSPFSGSEVVDFLDDLVFAGHRIEGEEKPSDGAFRLTSDTTVLDGSKHGLTSDSTSDGGGLVTDI